MRRWASIAELGAVVLVAIAATALLVSFISQSGNDTVTTPVATIPVEQLGSSGPTETIEPTPVVAVPEASPTAQALASPSPHPTATDATPTGISVTPTPDLTFLEERSLTYTLERVIVLSGQPEVVFARTMTPDELDKAAIYTPPFEDGCGIDFHIVIVRGDLDVRNEFFAPVAADVGMPVRYLVFMYYLADEGPLLLGLTGNPDGVGLGELLDDPSLPPLPTEAGEHNPHEDSTPLPC